MVHILLLVLRENFDIKTQAFHVHTHEKVVKQVGNGRKFYLFTHLRKTATWLTKPQLKPKAKKCVPCYRVRKQISYLHF